MSTLLSSEDRPNCTDGLAIAVPEISPLPKSQPFDRRRAHDELLLSEAVLERRPIGRPPLALDRVHHHFAHHDLVAVDVAALDLPCTLCGRAQVSSHTPETIGELVPDLGEPFVRHAPARVVVQRK